MTEEQYSEDILSSLKKYFAAMDKADYEAAYKNARTIELLAKQICDVAWNAAVNDFVKIPKAKGEKL